MPPPVSKDPKRLSFVRDLFFWIGVACAVASLSVVVFSNNPAVSKLERQSIPPSWILAGAAIGAMLVAERCNDAIPSHHAVSAPPVEMKPRVSPAQVAKDVAEEAVPVGATERHA